MIVAATIPMGALLPGTPLLRTAEAVPDVHVPVLVEEIVRLLAPVRGGRYLDGTFGRGGHSEALLRAAPGCRVLALDRDPAAAGPAAELAAREPGFQFRNADFRNLETALGQEGWDRVDGVLLDLGVSSPQLESAGRGFSLRRPGPLDMRFDPTRGESAAEMLDRMDAPEIADLLYRYGERRSRAIARRIVARRPLSTTGDLRAAVIAATGPGRGRLDPATRTFLAVRAAVNREEDALEAALESGPARLAVGGAMAVVAWHSEEDRPVKQCFRRLARTGAFELATPRPEWPSDAEIRRNRRARSARLRVLRRVASDEGAAA